MKAKLQALLDSLKAFANSIWLSIMADIHAIGVQVGVLGVIAAVIYVIIKYRDILISLIVGVSKRDVAAASKQDTDLKQQEDQAKAQADALQQQANALVPDKVDPNWYKK